MNQFKYEANNLKLDVAMEDSKDIISLVALILGTGSKQLTHVLDRVESAKEDKEQLNNKTPKNEIKPYNAPTVEVETFNTPITKSITHNPPIWIVECEECNDYITMNKSKYPHSTHFHCNKCGGNTPLNEEDKLVKTSYTCECGTKHDVMVYSYNKTISTKCRSCKMPIDLMWNDKKKMYVKL